MWPREGDFYLGTKPGMREGLLAADSPWLTNTPSLRMITFTVAYPGKPKFAYLRHMDDTAALALSLHGYGVTF